MHKIIQSRNIWFTISGIFVAVSILSLILWGLKPGIDFTGGSLLEVSYSEERPSVDQVNSSLADLNLKSLRVQPSGDQNFILRFEEVDETTHQNILQRLGSIKLDGVDNNQLTELSFESVGPVIGKELTIKKKLNKYSIMTYVLNSKDFAITGGEFEIKSSVNSCS